MLKVLLLCLVASAAAIDVATRSSQLGAADADTETGSRSASGLKQKWDIWGMKVATGKDRRHEAFVSEAYAQLIKNDDAATKFFSTTKLEHGIMWNDMPCDEDYLTYLNSVDWLIDYKAKAIPGIVHASHFGCVMHWHGMQSEWDPRSIKGSQVTEVFFSNANIKKQIYQMAQYWWDRAVAEGKGQGQPNNRPDVDKSSFTLGHLLHLVTDSFAEGHVLRGWSPLAILNKVDFTFKFDDVQSVTQCPPVVYYMGYIAEDGNDAHAKADHDPFLKDKTADPRNDQRRILAHCARAYAFKVLRAYYRCMSGQSCSFQERLKPVLDHAYAWADRTLSSKIAAGASDPFIGEEPKKSGKFAIDAALEYVDVLGNKQKDVWVPVPSALKKEGVRVWDAMAQDADADVRNAGLCNELTARYGYTRKWTRPFTAYVNPTPATTGGDDADPTVRMDMNTKVGKANATGNRAQTLVRSNSAPAILSKK